MKNRMLFDYTNSLDSQTRKTMDTRSQETGSLYLFMGVVMVLLGLLTWHNVRLLKADID